jgi:hypothetical protein
MAASISVASSGENRAEIHFAFAFSSGTFGLPRAGFLSCVTDKEL